MLERHLEVEELLARSDRHRAGRGRDRVVARLSQLPAHLPALPDGEGGVVDDLEPAVALDRVVQRVDLHRRHDAQTQVDLGLVAGQVDPPDRGVKDPRPVRGVGVLVRCLAGLEGAEPLTGTRVAGATHPVLVHRTRVESDTSSRVPSGETPHVVGAVPVHLLLDDDRFGMPASAFATSTHTTSAGLGLKTANSVPSLVGEHVVDELVVAFAGAVAPQVRSRRAARGLVDRGVGP
jgi:hypothetical protein